VFVSSSVVALSPYKSSASTRKKKQAVGRVTRSLCALSARVNVRALPRSQYIITTATPKEKGRSVNRPVRCVLCVLKTAR